MVWQFPFPASSPDTTAQWCISVSGLVTLAIELLNISTVLMIHIFDYRANGRNLAVSLRPGRQVLKLTRFMERLLTSKFRKNLSRLLSPVYFAITRIQ